MSEEVKVDQIKIALSAVLEAGNVLEKVVSEQGPVLAKLSHLTAMFDEVVALGSLDAAKLKEQLHSINESEKADLISHFKGKLDLSNESLESKIERGLELVVELQDVVRKIIAFAKA